MVDSLGDRMKKYENVLRYSLIHRMPHIIRLDGKAFHSWTRWCDKPFDVTFSHIMSSTLQRLLDNIQGAVFGYTQSDEISILLRDYDTFETQTWFDGNIQKIVSVAASLATGYFNQIANQYAVPPKPALAFFDARVFNLQKEEVNNYFVWRQQDILRNSIQAMGQHHLGHKKIQGLNNVELSARLADNGTGMDTVPQCFKHGITYSNETLLDCHVPLFTADPNYIERHVYFNKTMDQANISSDYKKLLNENKKLKEDSQLLHELRCAGVDNWEGYSEAMLMIGGNENY